MEADRTADDTKDATSVGASGVVQGNRDERMAMPPLMWAVLGSHFDSAQTLLDDGALIDGRDYAGRTALSMAAASGNMEGVKWLLAHGADVNATNDFGHTALMAASTYAGTAEITGLLLRHGAHVNTSGGVDALDLAIETGRVETARLLIGAAGSLDAIRLLGATRARNLDMVRLLLASGADVNAPRPDGLTPLIISAMFNDRDIMNVVLEAGADVNAVTTSREIFDIMVASGADADLLHVTGVTALMLAERNGNEGLVQRLRDAGARQRARPRRRFDLLTLEVSARGWSALDSPQTTRHLFAPIARA
jgi:hypothetical protein